MLCTTGPRAEYQAEAPRPGRLASIGEALEEALGAYAGRAMQNAKSAPRAGYSAVFEGAGSMSACGSVSTR